MMLILLAMYVIICLSLFDMFHYRICRLFDLFVIIMSQIMPAVFHQDHELIQMLEQVETHHDGTETTKSILVPYYTLQYNPQEKIILYEAILPHLSMIDSLKKDKGTNSLTIKIASNVAHINRVKLLILLFWTDFNLIFAILVSILHNSLMVVGKYLLDTWLIKILTFK